MDGYKTKVGGVAMWKTSHTHGCFSLQPAWKMLLALEQQWSGPEPQPGWMSLGRVSTMGKCRWVTPPGRTRTMTRTTPCPLHCFQPRPAPPNRQHVSRSTLLLRCVFLSVQHWMFLCSWILRIIDFKCSTVYSIEFHTQPVNCYLLLHFSAVILPLIHFILFGLVTPPHMVHVFTSYKQFS